MARRSASYASLCPDGPWPRSATRPRGTRVAAPPHMSRARLRLALGVFLTPVPALVGCTATTSVQGPSGPRLCPRLVGAQLLRQRRLLMRQRRRARPGGLVPRLQRRHRRARRLHPLLLRQVPVLVMRARSHGAGLPRHLHRVLPAPARTHPTRRTPASLAARGARATRAPCCTAARTDRFRSRNRER